MNLSSKQENGILVLTVAGRRIDAASAIYFKDQFREATVGTDGRVMMDLAQVDFIDSSGLGAIVAALKLLNGRMLELSGLSPAVEKVFRLTRMDQVFTIHADTNNTTGNTIRSNDGANAA